MPLPLTSSSTGGQITIFICFSKRSTRWCVGGVGVGAGAGGGGGGGGGGGAGVRWWWPVVVVVDMMVVHGAIM